MLQRLTVFVLALLLLSAPPSAADELDVDGDSVNPSVILDGTRDDAGSGGASTSGTGSPSPVSGPSGPLPEYQWLLACAENFPDRPMINCGSAQSCPVADQSLWVLWTRPPGGNWSVSSSECYDEAPQVPNQPARPTVTAAMVEEAVRRMGLPSLPLNVQPADATLVNFDTIFYTEPIPFDRQVTLVGYNVRVVAVPASYGWAFGDGTTLTTSLPGAPYPAKDVTHIYADAHVTVQPSVDVTYEVRYSVDGGEMQELDATLTAEGPSTGLRIREATPLLAGAG